MRNATYVNSGHINGICIPLPIQTNYIKNYCEQIGETLPLPSTEVGLLGKNPTLDKLLMANFDNIFYATHMLIPRGFVSGKALSSLTKHHFILEKMSIVSSELVDFLNQRDFINTLGGSNPIAHILNLAKRMEND